MKRFRKIILIVFAVLATFAGTITLIGLFYGEQVKQYLVKELNSRLDTQINVREINFSVWKKFPLASVTFHDVVVPGSWGSGENEGADTLLAAKEVYFSMSLLDLIRNNYNISSVTCEQGFVRVLMDERGRGNYNITKSTGDTASLKITLEEILLEQLHFLYADHQSGDSIQVQIDDASAQGDLSNETFGMNASLHGTVHQLLLSKLDYPLRNKPLVLDGALDVNTLSGIVDFTDVNVTLAAMEFNVGGMVQSGDQKQIDLKAGGKDLDIRSFLSLLPEEYHQIVERYSSEGNFYFNAAFKGPYGGLHVPVVSADFGIRGGTVSYDDSPPLRKLNIDGSFTNQGRSGSESMKLVVTDFSASMEKSSLAGSFTIENFISPLVSISTDSKIDLEEFMKLFPNDSIPSLQGMAVIDARFHGRIKDPSHYTIDDFKHSETAGELKVENVSIVPLTGNTFTALTGSFLFDNNDIIVQELTGFLGASDFYLKGFFRNIISYFFVPDNKLVIDAQLHSKELALDDILRSEESDAENHFDLNFSDQAALYLNADIASLKYKKFSASSIKGRVVIRDRKLVTENLTFDAFDGSLNMAGLVNATDISDIRVECDLQAKQVNMRKLFAECDDFGQETMKSDHIRGKADIMLHYKMATDSALNIPQDKIYALADISIKEGELIGFEPMNNLSRFIEIDELKHVRFGELTNQIEIRDRRINIPLMHLSSSAMDLDLSGWHTFDNEIDYRFRILLSELLETKARKKGKEDEEYAIFEVEDGKARMALYLAMKGTVDDPRFTYDRMGVSKKLQADAASEKQTVKGMLNKEFGLYKGDTSLPAEANKEPVKFQIEWEEATPAPEPKEDPDRFKTKKKEGKMKRWMDKLPGESTEE